MKMLTNLFSVFDPQTHLKVGLNWIILALILWIPPLVKWISFSYYLEMCFTVLLFLSVEIKSILQKSSLELSILFISIFMLVTLSNSMGLLPYVFTSTSHLVITLSLSFPIWLSYYLWGWWMKSSLMLAHLVPQGTPILLMPFMVIIESISSLIRPFTLAVRLSANMIAGHLLLALMGGASHLNYPKVSLIIIISQVALVILETAVAFIQAYVFVILSTLYASEVAYDKMF